eukprot:Lankesteria_metandrocarpae@DN5442_c0_g2_i4.p1
MLNHKSISGCYLCLLLLLVNYPSVVLLNSTPTITTTSTTVTRNESSVNGSELPGAQHALQVVEAPLVNGTSFSMYRNTLPKPVSIGARKGTGKPQQTGKRKYSSARKGTGKRKNTGAGKDASTRNNTGTGKDASTRNNTGKRGTNSTISVSELMTHATISEPFISNLTKSQLKVNADNKKQKHCDSETLWCNGCRRKQIGASTPDWMRSPDLFYYHRYQTNTSNYNRIEVQDVKSLLRFLNNHEEIYAMYAKERIGTIILPYGIHIMSSGIRLKAEDFSLLPVVVIKKENTNRTPFVDNLFVDSQFGAVRDVLGPERLGIAPHPSGTDEYKNQLVDFNIGYGSILESDALLVRPLIKIGKRHFGKGHTKGVVMLEGLEYYETLSHFVAKGLYRQSAIPKVVAWIDKYERFVKAMRNYFTRRISDQQMIECLLCKGEFAEHVMSMLTATGRLVLGDTNKRLNVQTFYKNLTKQQQDIAVWA